MRIADHVERAKSIRLRIPIRGNTGRLTSEKSLLSTVTLIDFTAWLKSPFAIICLYNNEELLLYVTAPPIKFYRLRIGLQPIFRSR